jgi:hypothetical protein
VYSYGIVLWELWTGREPFEGLNYHALLHQMTSAGEAMRPPLPGSADWDAAQVCDASICQHQHWPHRSCAWQTPAPLHIGCSYTSIKRGLHELPPPPPQTASSVYVAFRR